MRPALGDGIAGLASLGECSFVNIPTEERRCATRLLVAEARFAPPSQKAEWR